MLVDASLLVLLVAVAIVAMVAASPDCNTVGLTAAVTNIDSKVDWQPRFAGVCDVVAIIDECTHALTCVHVCVRVCEQARPAKVKLCLSCRGAERCT